MEKIQGFEAEVLLRGHIAGAAEHKQAKAEMWSKGMRRQQQS